MRGVERAAFWIAVLLFGATFWISPYPPMGDLPQHAGQVALWRDLIKGTSPWQAHFSVNYLTPYVLGSGVAVLLSFVMPVTAALKLLLTLAYLGFVGACVLLRRWRGGDSRLDWLFIPGYFGLACSYGFFPFLVALPVGMLFIALAYRYAERPSMKRGAGLALAGLVAFFSHGLAFVFANLVGSAFLLCRSERRHFAASLVPYVLLGFLGVWYILMLRLADADLMPADRMAASWPGPMSVVKHLLAFPIGVPSADWLLLPLVPLLIVAPLLAGYRVDWGHWPGLVPITVLLAWCFVVPDSFMDTWFMGSRFAVFLLPFYALMLRPGAAGPLAPARLALPVLCVAFLGSHIQRDVAFTEESRSFREVLAAAEPLHRARFFVGDVASAATRNLMAYVHFPLWYQVDKGGLVDFNFAYFASGIVRYRQDRMPPDDYRYYFIRSAAAVPPLFLPPGGCAPVLVKRVETWSLFESVKC